MKCKSVHQLADGLLQATIGWAWVQVTSGALGCLRLCCTAVPAGDLDCCQRTTHTRQRQQGSCSPDPSWMQAGRQAAWTSFTSLSCSDFPTPMMISGNVSPSCSPSGKIMRCPWPL